MHFPTTISAAAFLGMLATTTAHMVIHEPVPYGKSTLLNGPLADDGSDFPCKQRPGVYDITSMNTLQVGVPNTLSFMGGATHSGGSCQVSVSLDKEPTKDSQWKVIHSIIGGCPSNVTGNLIEDASSLAASVFSYQIPKGMPNGQYTLAWTWFNKVGNREMYMNCAPITVTGGADNNDVFSKLPDMFVINIPSGQCATVEGEDFVFPSPGDSVETPFSTALGSKTVGSGCAAVTGKGAGSGVASAPASAASGGPASYGSGASSAAMTAPVQASTAPAYSAPASPQSVPAAQATSGADSSIVTVTTMSTVTSASPSSAAVSAPTSSAPAPAYSAPAPAAAPAAAPESGSSSSSNSTTSSGTCSNGAVACSNPGAVVCIGTTQFGLCDISNCAVPEALASGTTCSGGVIARRSVRHGRRQLAGRRRL
ncbi:hypothetical protein LTR78_000220 [Recurvomyces mirabilis]|uniref:Lytic polysaccharide monooxygenase n=1 Tax=Recurvomyces mirabilis TaxID=574656 RepID=A0AAE0WXH9_9PEZI|nr:hypothetical protein LTR78_000220 [Recurvomyces mirabilis]KAK5161876.1 hypothetical protein LTS14_000221 [Recurvomyces mirabilis]